VKIKPGGPILNQSFGFLSPGQVAAGAVGKPIQRWRPAHEPYILREKSPNATGTQRILRDFGAPGVAGLSGVNEVKAFRQVNRAARDAYAGGNPAGAESLYGQARGMRSALTEDDKLTVRSELEYTRAILDGLDTGGGYADHISEAEANQPSAVEIYVGNLPGQPVLSLLAPELSLLPESVRGNPYQVDGGGYLGPSVETGLNVTAQTMRSLGLNVGPPLSGREAKTKPAGWASWFEKYKWWLAAGVGVVVVGPKLLR